MADRDRDRAYEHFVTRAEPAIRRALSAAYGPERGREAALDALSWAWEHWDRVRPMANPTGYVFRVGQSRAVDGLRREARPPRADGSATVEMPDLVPELPAAMAILSEQQRTAVVLVHGYGMTLREVAELMNVSIATVRTHCERALDRLRNVLEVS